MILKLGIAGIIFSQTLMQTFSFIIAPFRLFEDEINAEDFGNILYGFAGNAGGYSCSELKFGGSLYSKIKSGECDNGTDSLNIQKGYDMYDDVKKDYYYIHITA